MTPAVLALSDVVKTYGALRPLRIQALVVRGGDTVALLGFDSPMAEVFVNIVTGATLPDSGEVQAFGRPTAAVSDSADWLALVDRFGIVSARAVLLGELSVIQNLSMPFTLDIEPPADDIRARAEALAGEAGLPEASWPRPVSELGAVDRARLRVARALAHDPGVLLLEHASAEIPPRDVRLIALEIRRLAEARRVAIVAVTADEDFAGVVAARILSLEPASGRLRERRQGWLARVLG